MMMRNLILKTLYDKRWFMVGWGAAFFFMTLLVVTFYPSFNSSFQLDEMSSNLPEAFQSLIGDAANLKTIKGYLAEQLYNIRIPIFLLIMSIVLGLSLSVSDEDSGKLRTLSALPISRGKILFSKFLSAVLIVGLTSLATTLATYVGVLIINESAPNALIWQLFGLSWLFGSVAVAIVLGVGLASGKKSLTTGFAILVTIGSFIISTFGVAVSWLEPYEKFSLLHYYNAIGLNDNSFSSVDLLVLVLIIVFFYALAWLPFRKRDIV